jgi:single-strand DNA-binding protein
MGSFNRVILMGNLTTTFVDVTMFGKRGEAFARFHGKGKPAFIEGKLRLDSWEDKNGGGKRSKLYVVADSWEFCGGGREGGGGGGGYGGGGQQQQSGGGGGDTWGGDAAFEESMSDTPF